ncbi:MAG: transporter permease [Balneola sp.]|jgi:ABC-type antimicrobial peptide transport system permease subunit|nr:transporter permease [Balneola sp.]MBE78259.1 transporter permease [Balneola sp.]|tara:strand:+ start:2028 stop:4379 length:2352 start_codon:yes stop_codon:yes gene_type:complete
MFKNYLKTAFRSFKRHKSSFLINVIGLSIGMACSILILLWVLDELEYDRFHADVDQIYQVMEHQSYSADVMTTLSTPGILAPALKEEVPEFQYTSTYTWPVEYLFTKESKSLKETGFYARPDIFHILDINLLHGNRDELINSPKTVVVSKEIAVKYFGTENAVGESITLNSNAVHTVTGVFEKLPENSSFQFDYVLPFEDWLANNDWATSWGNNGPRTITKLYPGVDVDALNRKIADFVQQKDEDDSNVELFVYPSADLYLYGQFENRVQTGGRIDYVRLFTVVAIFILLIACINFMNLSTAKATKRAKEVGIRKSIGASQGSLIGQFLGESMMITFFSLIVSVFFVELSLPVFNDLTSKAIDVQYGDPTLLLIFLGTALFTGFIAGSYPAFYLSSFEAVKTLKGNLKISGSEAFARKGLVVFQFTLSVILIISTIVVYQQIQYTQNKSLGYKKENLITFTVEGDVRNNWDTFKEQIKTIPGVVNASRSNSSFLGRNSNTSGLDWPGKLPDTQILFENVSADYGLVETMGFEVISGRTHSEEFGADTSRILINEVAANVMGLDNPVGQFITLWGEETEIIGLVRDFNYENLRNDIEPLFFRLSEFGGSAYVRIESDNIRETLAQVEDKYKEFNPTYPFAYEFMDDQYAALYRSEQRIGDLAKYFSIFAVIISCLGLFGLSAFTAEQRAKEIGVRKVLGATVQSLVIHLTKDFTKLVLIAILIAIPVSWWMMDTWLSDFAYNAGLSWWIFAGSGFLAVVIAWLTVSWQSIKAALMNPVQSLKSE